MGRTYTVPRSVKGESRILLIFSVKSLISTVMFGIVGLILFSLFSSIGLKIIGWICIGVFAAVGWAVGALTIPDTPIVGDLRKAGGEQVSDILIRTLTFKNRKKIYMYREGDKR